jgi:Fe-S-cluster containining protein
MSLCDKCYAPGQCCRRMHLTGFDGLTFWKDDYPIETARHLLDSQGIPFSIHSIASSSKDENGREYIAFWYTCSLLLPNGRCGSYENRPQLCRDFEPASERLCVHYRGAEAGDPTVSIDTVAL